MAGGTRRFVDEKLKQRTVLLFSKTRDPDCLTVKRVLAEYAMPPNIYEVCEIEQRQDCPQMETYFLVLCMGSHRKVPRLFIKGKYIGSEREITRLHESGELRSLLTEAEALN